MSVATTQSTTSFRQLGLLRKAFSKKLTGTFSYTSQSGHKGQLTLVMGNIIGGDIAINELSHFLAEPVSQCDWVTRSIEYSDDGVEPTLAISRAMNHVQWSNNVIISLRSLFLKLPAVRIRMVPLHRYGYTDGLSYLILYQQSVQQENFLLADFLNQAGDAATLKRHIKVLVLGFCLGLITAATKTSEIANQKNNTAGIAARILRRVRGM
jgi:hypothetical protein